MENQLLWLALIAALLPLAGSLIAGLFGKVLGRTATHRVAITLVAIAFLIACYLFKVIVIDGFPAVEGNFYHWAVSGFTQFNVGFLLDRLSVTMITVVLFVSLAVHIYTIGYMADDPKYQLFFCYVSLFTFAMLMLVLGNNFLVLFFGWEGVGLVSYLLIGFWFERESAVFGSLKAFIVNRIGDVGFLLAMTIVLYYFGTLNYAEVFKNAPLVAHATMPVTQHYAAPVLFLISLLLFIGAMGKSAQVPLHVWLPESMEGPTPISALIHAATMVTAGIYMVARMSPVFEYAPQILSFILVIGGTTALFTGLLAVVQFDIKRVIAYSTLSQLGYMTVALGASAYDAAIFHLVTHAFFKALLFLGAGSVIIAMHHEQDMRKMGGLARYMPITYATFLIGTLALSAIPPFAGFFSKDIIIEAVKESELTGAGYAYFCVLLGAFITPLYAFRSLFMTFHTHERFKGSVSESPWVVLIPLIALAIPSVFAGQLLIDPMLFATPKMLGKSIFVLPQHNVLDQLANGYHGATLMALNAGRSLTFWLSILGIATAWLYVARFPAWSESFKKRFSLLYNILRNKYGFDDFNQIALVHGTRNVGDVCYEVGDVKLIDGVFVNGSGRFVRWFAQMAKRMQTGFIYDYALSMVLGVGVFLAWYVGGF